MKKLFTVLAIFVLSSFAIASENKIESLEVHLSDTAKVFIYNNSGDYVFTKTEMLASRGNIELAFSGASSTPGQNCTLNNTSVTCNLKIETTLPYCAEPVAHTILAICNEEDIRFVKDTFQLDLAWDTETQEGLFKLTPVNNKKFPSVEVDPIVDVKLSEVVTLN